MSNGYPVTTRACTPPPSARARCDVKRVSDLGAVLEGVDQQLDRAGVDADVIVQEEDVGDVTTHGCHTCLRHAGNVRVALGDWSVGNGRNYARWQVVI